MKDKIINTDLFLTNSELALIRTETLKAEKQQKLTRPILNLIYKKQWLKIVEPQSCGGSEWALPQVVQLFETLAFADGNLGWCVNLGAGANLFSGYFQKEIAKEIFHAEKTWCAGSGAPSGKAIKQKEGFILSGKWKYASGSAHATHFTANAFIYDAAENPIKEGQKPAFRSFIVPKKKVEILDTWKVSGLKATSSNTFEIKNIYVPNTKTFRLTQPSSFAKAPIFHFPFDLMAVVNMAAMPMGMTVHFLECFEQIFNTKKPLNSKKKLKENTKVFDTFRTLKAEFTTARKSFYLLLNQVWEYYEQNKTTNSQTESQLRENALAIATIARKIIFKLFPMCGMNIIYEDAEINKVWRDLSVAGQHYLLTNL